MTRVFKYVLGSHLNLVASESEMMLARGVVFVRERGNTSRGVLKSKGNMLYLTNY